MAYRLGTGCGLASKRGTNRYRYAPTDDLLRALVLANVIAPMEESAFLRHLHRRYRISIGPTEAKNEVLSYQFDETDFKKNRDRFGQHLVGMGRPAKERRLHLRHQSDGVRA